jgi:hypothetical protein
MWRVISYFENCESMERAGAEAESALHQLRENLILDEMNQQNHPIRRLVSFNTKERIRERCRFDIRGSMSIF